MKWYDLIISEEAGPAHPYFGDEHELFGRDWDDFGDGRFIEDWNSNSLLRSTAPESDGNPGDVLNNSMNVLIFSERLRMALGDIGSRDIQYLPIRVARSTGEELSGFAIANIITRVPALDADRCFMLDLDYDKMDPATGKPRVKNFGRAALLKEPLEGHDVIRLLENQYDVFVSERFVKVYKKHRFTGASFSPVRVS